VDHRQGGPPRPTIRRVDAESRAMDLAIMPTLGVRPEVQMRDQFLGAGVHRELGRVQSVNEKIG
jgi:hypothetical protein